MSPSSYLKTNFISYHFFFVQSKSTLFKGIFIKRDKKERTGWPAYVWLINKSVLILFQVLLTQLLFKKILGITFSEIRSHDLWPSQHSDCQSFVTHYLFLSYSWVMNNTQSLKVSCTHRAYVIKVRVIINKLC